MNHFQLLPFEVLEDMFSKMQPREIILLSKICRLFRDVAQSDKLWRQVSHREFGVQLPISKNGFARRFYKNVLHQYGQYLGFWTKEVNHIKQDYYGGLLQITYSDEQLHGIELQVPKIPHLLEPLRPKTIFTIFMDEEQDDLAVVKCYCINQQHQHNCILQYNEKVLVGRSTPSWYLTRQCSGTAIGAGMGLQGRNALLQQYLADHLDMDNEDATGDHVIGLLELKFSALLRENESHYSRFRQLPSACVFNVPIQPGIFKGTNGHEGIQLLSISYTDERTVTGFKITGDVWVPAGEVSFQADLRDCMYLDQDSQSLEQLEQRRALSDVNWSELPSPQPCFIPLEWQSLLVPIAPDQCLARFRGTWQRDIGHWIVFNEDLFGFLSFNSRRPIWTVFRPLWTLFHRVKNPALQITTNP